MSDRAKPASEGGMRSEIEQKWGKFSAEEIAELKDNDDLVAQIQTKYSRDKSQAQRDVDAFARGRQLWFVCSCRGRRPYYLSRAAPDRD